MKILLFIAIFSISNIANAEPNINTVFEQYDIFPTSKNDLRREMLNRSPTETNGRKFIGHTRWRVTWNFKWQKSEGVCTISRVNSTLDVTYTMPQIAAGHEVALDVLESFKNYYAALLTHEKEHMKSGLYAAREIEDAILNLGSFKRCDTLNEAANAAGNRLIKKYIKRDRAYDRKTDHGKTEGVDVNNFI